MRSIAQCHIRDNIVQLTCCLSLCWISHANGEDARVETRESRYPNKQLKQRWHVEITKDGETNHGLSERWDEKGNKQFEINFVHGKAEGNALMWYDDGTKQSSTPFKNGKKNGKSTMWYKNGTVSAETTYVDGKEDGEEKWFTEAGALITSLTWRKGEPWEGWRLTGNFESAVEKPSKADRTAIDPIKLRRQVYSNGKLIEDKPYATVEFPEGSRPTVSPALPDAIDAQK